MWPVPPPHPRVSGPSAPPTGTTAYAYTGQTGNLYAPPSPPTGTPPVVASIGPTYYNDRPPRPACGHTLFRIGDSCCPDCGEHEGRIHIVTQESPPTGTPHAPLTGGEFDRMEQYEKRMERHDGFCPHCRGDIGAQVAHAYDAGRDSVDAPPVAATKEEP